MNITPAFLQQAIGCTAERAAVFATHLADACAAYQIDTPARLAAFLAQIGHESGSLRYTSELWGPTPAQERYEGRADLGNTQPGDGRAYAGHGLIQTTGRANHRAVRDRLLERGMDCPDFEANPSLLTTPKWASWSAADYWDMRHLNALADAGEIIKIGRAINRGNANSQMPANGEADRLQRWERAKVALAAMAADPPLVHLGPEPVAEPAPAPRPYTPPRPDQEPYVTPQPEAAMPIPSVFIGAAIDAIFTAAPKLLDIFKGSSDNAKRNVEATKMLLEVGRAATGAANEQQIVEALQTSPEAVAALREAVEKRWFDIHNAAEKSQALSRDWIKEYSEITNVRLVWLNMTFIELLTFFFAITGMFGGIGLLIWGALAPSLQGAVITLMLIESVVGVRKAWIGNTPTVPPAPKD